MSNKYTDLFPKRGLPTFGQVGTVSKTITLTGEFSPEFLPKLQELIRQETANTPVSDLIKIGTESAVGKEVACE